MDIRLIFRNHQSRVKGRRNRVGQPPGWKRGAKRVGRRRVQGKPHLEVEARRGRKCAEVIEPSCQEKPLNGEAMVPVPQTDTGGQVEDTKANGKTFVKELGKLTP